MFTLRDIPAAMRRNGWSVGAQLMDRWFRGSARIMSRAEKEGDRPPVDLETRLVTMRWAMRVNRVINAHDKLVAEWATRARAGPGHALLVRRVQSWSRAKGGGKQFRFGDLSRPTIEVQAACQINFERIVSGMFAGVDDFYAALGNATLNLAVTGIVRPAGARRLAVTVDELGFYLRDTYDFNGDQMLGSWGESGIMRTAVGAPDIQVVAETARDDPGQAYWRVGNNSFNRYRAHYARGGDFVILSDLARRRLAQPVTIEIPA